MGQIYNYIVRDSLLSGCLWQTRQNSILPLENSHQLNQSDSTSLMTLRTKKSKGAYSRLNQLGRFVVTNFNQLNQRKWQQMKEFQIRRIRTELAPGKFDDVHNKSQTICTSLERPLSFVP
ncbi:hypothetical protein FGO68_gene9348 [Halteria grandinella]|uniref:Uncharacterized protein n=1 Tax=Halteria grandinella TaxID=5974 RepID=A0A8J8NR23_HALGN|nr:hypothetical protein FGO68_gene9348 [Halteria grandinella]